MSNSKIINQLPKDSPPDDNPQERIEWATIAIAVPREFKNRFEFASRKMRLRPSQYGRMLLMDALSRVERPAA